MTSKIVRAKFCGLRRLNAVIARESSSDFFPFWTEQVDDWYEFKSINVFVGENGSGKSTALELIDFCRNPTRVSNLSRENRINHSLAAFTLEFTNDIRIQARIDPIGQEAYDCAQNIKDWADGDARGLQLGLHILDETKAWRHFSKKLLRNIHSFNLDKESSQLIEERWKLLDCSMFYFEFNFDRIECKNAVPILNDARKYLTGVYKDEPKHVRSEDDLDFRSRKRPFLERLDRKIGIYLSDDLDQYNTVELDALPSGWKQLVAVIHWLTCEVSDDSVCLIEEPETHLHPHLQRYLARVIADLVKKKRLQLFLTTHSAIFQNRTTWKAIPENEAWIFEATGERFEKYPNTSRILDSLGYLSSDISQSNGVIWVEGPSDRIYLKHWLSIWCQENDNDVPIENIEYSFCFYGGATLSHFSAENADKDGDEFINLIKHNRNFAIVIDRDNDYEYSANDELVCLNPKSYKQRILSMEKANPKGMFWITHGYTIENYLEHSATERYFQTTSEEKFVLKNTSTPKVRIARNIINGKATMIANPALSTELNTKISSLYSRIRSWNY